jgi:predicted RNA-binding protein with PUA-like domain
MAYWLMKSEPDSFSIDDLKRKVTEPWSGVRNFMARNHMRRMSLGDDVLFYHSSVDPPGVAGLARVCTVNVVDETQFDPDSPYYDPKATRAKPRWDCVDVEYVRTFDHFVPLSRLRLDPELEEMLVLQRGMRLSVQPVDGPHFHRIVAMADSAWSPPEPPRKLPKPKKKPAKAPTKQTIAML